jgi:hypothetical protein
MDSVDLSRSAWRKSSHSGGSGDCVEMAVVPFAVAIRDSKNPTGPALAFTPQQWDLFLSGVKAGRFDQR